MKAKLRQCISDEIDIQPNALDGITDNFEVCELAADEYFLKAGSVCRSMAFINSGFLRMYNFVEDREVTLWIGFEKSFLTSLSSFIHQTPSRWYIQAITDCELLTISRDQHLDMLEHNSKWLEFDNQILTNAFTMLEQRIFSHLYMTAEERYQDLMENQPFLFNAVPLKYIASMIGVTPETLSRLRSR